MADVIANKVFDSKKTYAKYPKGIVLSKKAEYTILAGGSPGIGETLTMLPLPKGAELIDFTLEADGGTTNMTVAVGDGTTVDKFLVATANAAAVQLRMGKGFGTSFASAGNLVITFGTAAPTAGDVYTMVAQYRMN
jgi:hypothetical protein